jgi:hypothetical protein
MLKGRRMNDGLFPNYDTPTQYNMGADALSQGQPFSLYKDPNNPGTYYAGPPSKSGGKLPKKRADLVAVVTASIKDAFDKYALAIKAGGAAAAEAKILMEALSIGKKILTPEEFLKAERNAKLLGKEGDDADDYTEDEVSDLVKDKITKWAKADPSHVVKESGRAFIRFVNDDLMKLRNKLIRDSNVRYYYEDTTSAAATAAGGKLVVDKTDEIIEKDVLGTGLAKASITSIFTTGLSENAKANELEAITEEFRKEYERVVKKWDQQKYSKRRTGIISGLTRVLDGAAKRIARAGRRKYKKCKKGKKRMLSIVSTCGSKSKKRRSLSKKLRVLRASLRKKKGSKSKSPKSKSKSKSPKSKSRSKKAKGSKRRVSAWNKHVKAFCKSHLGKGKKYASLAKCVKAAKKTYKSKARK